VKKGGCKYFEKNSAKNLQREFQLLFPPIKKKKKGRVPATGGREKNQELCLSAQFGMPARISSLDSIFNSF